MRVPQTSLDVITEVASILQNAALMVDDIEDNSPLRRSKPATHVLFGKGKTINSANYAIVLVAKKFRTLKNSEVNDILLEELENIFTGQSWDLQWRSQMICPSESDYINMADNKTGGFFRMMMALLRATSAYGRHQEVDLTRFSALLGRYYQIRDDYMNLQAGEYTNTKGFCEDLEEGKLSLLVAHTLHVRPDFHDHIFGIFKIASASTSGSNMQPLHTEWKNHILDCMEKAGTFQHTLDLMIRLEEEMGAEISKVEDFLGIPNPLLSLLLGKLSLKPLAAQKEAGLYT